MWMWMWILNVLTWIQLSSLLFILQSMSFNHNRIIIIIINSCQSSSCSSFNSVADRMGPSCFRLFDSFWVSRKWILQLIFIIIWLNGCEWLENIYFLRKPQPWNKQSNGYSHYNLFSRHLMSTTPHSTLHVHTHKTFE